MTGEFDVIERYFKRLTMGRAEALGLSDDAAVIGVPEGCDLVVSGDTFNENIHFISGQMPENIAKKALRVNLSDMAAMGAQPLCYQLSTSFGEKPDEEWLARFTSALLEDQIYYGVFCSGGDTTLSGGGLSISMTVMGTVQAGKAIKRSGACDGDVLLLTGVVGDAYIGLKQALGELEAANSDYFQEKMVLPNPRVNVAETLQMYAHAAVDISDGLIADLGHICKTSGVGAEVDLTAVQFSKNAQNLIDNGAVHALDLLSGGDDYELLVAVAPADVEAFIQALEKSDVPVQKIGRFNAGCNGVVLSGEDQEKVSVGQTGWSHF